MLPCIQFVAGLGPRKAAGLIKVSKLIITLLVVVLLYFINIETNSVWCFIELETGDITSGESITAGHRLLTGT